MGSADRRDRGAAALLVPWAGSGAAIWGSRYGRSSRGGGGVAGYRPGGARAGPYPLRLGHGMGLPSLAISRTVRTRIFRSSRRLRRFR